MPHPHYGTAPQLNGVRLKDAAAFGPYEYQPSWTFPTTRIVAIPSRQNYSQMPRTDYFDVLRKILNDKFLLVIQSFINYDLEFKFKK